MSNDLTFGATETTPEARGRHAALFKQCFPQARVSDMDYLDWLYNQNPVGAVVGFDAFHGETLAATYVCIPIDLLLDGAPVRGLLSLNTATAPAFQGRGLFTRLASMTYDFAREQGFDVVVGVANQNSVGGFTRKLGFQDVAGLDARIGYVVCADGDAAAERHVQLRRKWTPNSFAWRQNNPLNRLVATLNSNGTVLVTGKTGYFGLKVGALVRDDVGPVARRRRLPLPLLTLSLTPSIMAKSRWAISIPERFKPSPLRFIYRPLSDQRPQLDPGNLLWSFLDFDAY